LHTFKKRIGLVKGSTCPPPSYPKELVDLKLQITTQTDDAAPENELYLCDKYGLFAALPSDIVTANKLARPRQIELSRLEPGDRKAPFEFGDGNATPIPSSGRSGESRAPTANVEELRLSEKYSEIALARISWEIGLGGTPAKPPKELTKRLSKAVVLDFCATGASNNPMKRSLVSLNEANDVARRLGEMKARAAKEKENKKSNDNGDEDDNKAPSTEEAISFQLQNARRWSKALEDLLVDCTTISVESHRIRVLNCRN
jgi:hypothetical protein